MIFKKICIVSANRSDYAKIRFLVKKMKDTGFFDMHFYITGSMASKRHGSGVVDISNDGFIPDFINTFCSDSDLLVDMVKTVGLDIFEIGPFLSKLKPDAVMLVGDRWDILPAAVSSCLMNIPLIHIQGGEKSGTIDNVIRDVISKLSHIHFAATKTAANNLKMLDEQHVYHTGCPSIDFINSINVGEDICINNFKQYIKENFILSKNDDYFMIIVHPNVTIPNDIDIKEIFDALSKFNNKQVWFYPNNDPFSEQISKEIRHRKNIIKFSHISMELFITLMAHAKCLIGNSSSGIREASTFGLPVVNIGLRQNNRERNDNVIDVCCKSEEIVNAVHKSLNSKYNKNNLYGDGNASNKIIEILLSYEKLNYKNIYVN